MNNSLTFDREGKRQWMKISNKIMWIEGLINVNLAKLRENESYKNK